MSGLTHFATQRIKVYHTFSSKSKQDFFIFAIVMDTKWKRLIDDASKNYGISQVDMYQMYAYSKKYNAKDICLLYPLNNDMRKYTDSQNAICFNSKIDDTKTGEEIETCVHVFFVDVANIEDSLYNLMKILQTTV